MVCGRWSPVRNASPHGLACSLDSSSLYPCSFGSRALGQILADRNRFTLRIPRRVVIEPNNNFIEHNAKAAEQSAAFFCFLPPKGANLVSNEF